MSHFNKHHTKSTASAERRLKLVTIAIHTPMSTPHPCLFRPHPPAARVPKQKHVRTRSCANEGCSPTLQCHRHASGPITPALSHRQICNGITHGRTAKKQPAGQDNDRLHNGKQRPMVHTSKNKTTSNKKTRNPISVSMPPKQRHEEPQTNTLRPYTGSRR